MMRAQQAVDSLDSKMITEIKATKKPPPVFEVIMDTVCILFMAKINSVAPAVDFPIVVGNLINTIKPSYDECGKVVLSDMNFLKSLKSYDKDNINNETIELLEPYLSHTEWYNETIAAKASIAAKSIMRWVLAVVEYHEKSQIVKPKRIKLVQEEGRLSIATE